MVLGTLFRQIQRHQTRRRHAVVFQTAGRCHNVCTEVDVIPVYITDTGIAYEQAEEHFAQAAAWASQHCLSFVDYHVQDVSDHSYLYDYVTEYQFGDSKDAMLFELKYKTH